VSVPRNEKNDITGLLLYANGLFLQVVEGPASAIDELMARLARDPRHHGINVLSSTEVTEREFAQWSMGFKHVSQSDLREYPHFAPFFSPDFDPAQLGTPGVSIDIMRSLVQSAG